MSSVRFRNTILGRSTTVAITLVQRDASPLIV